MLPTRVDQIDLFLRSYRLQVADRLISEMQIRFTVRKSITSKKPNSADFEIMNLNADTRQFLSKLDSVYVQLDAGYRNGMSTLFRGELGTVWSERQGTEWVTTVTSQDSAKAAKNRRVQKTYPSGTTLVVLFRQLAEASGLALGNTEAIAATAAFLGTGQRTAPSGYTTSGDVDWQLYRLARACGLTYSVQDGQIQFLPFKASLAEPPIILNAGTGLLDSPEVGRDHIVKASTLLVPGLYPGRTVEVEATHASGTYRIDTATYRGDYEGAEWVCDLELSAKRG